MDRRVKHSASLPTTKARIQRLGLQAMLTAHPPTVTGTRVGKMIPSRTINHLVRSVNLEMRRKPTALARLRKRIPIGFSESHETRTTLLCVGHGEEHSSRLTRIVRKPSTLRNILNASIKPMTPSGEKRVGKKLLCPFNDYLTPSH